MTIISGRIINGAVIAIVIAAVVVGLFLLGSPAEERLRRLDSRRVNDLKLISNAVNAYRTTHKRLPADLDELARQPGLNQSFCNLNFLDPVTGQRYEYQARGDSTYVLCATFQRDSAREATEQVRDFWSHGVGRQCFEFVVRDVQ